jgi:hypothetical protein
VADRSLDHAVSYRGNPQWALLLRARLGNVQPAEGPRPICIVPQFLFQAVQVQVPGEVFGRDLIDPRGAAAADAGLSRRGSPSLGFPRRVRCLGDVWASPLARGLATTAGRIAFVILRTGCSRRVAFPLLSRERSYPSLQSTGPALARTCTSLIQRAHRRTRRMACALPRPRGVETRPNACTTPACTLVGRRAKVAWENHCRR